MTTEAHRLLSLHLCGVGGQMLSMVVRQLGKRLVPLCHHLQMEETHGMARRGGIVAAAIECEFRDGVTSTVPRALLALELIEGARALTRLSAGQSAFIAERTIAPPGARDGRPTPTVEQLQSVARDLGVALHVVPGDAPWAVVQAAINAGVVP